jgi:hypothetical protein
MHEDLPIRSLDVNQQVTGAYRGEKFQSVPGAEGEPAGSLAAGVLDTDDGPVAIWGNESVLNKIRALRLSDGDQITIARPTQDTWLVIQHG